MADELDAIKQQLESVVSNSSQPIVTAYGGDSTGVELIGNRPGFIRLAITSLEAAQGNNINFEHHTWLRATDGVRLDGFSYDEAGGEVPEISKFRARMTQIFGFVIVLLIAGIFVLGVASAYQHIRHLLNL